MASSISLLFRKGLITLDGRDCGTPESGTQKKVFVVVDFNPEQKPFQVPTKTGAINDSAKTLNTVNFTKLLKHFNTLP